MKKQRACLPSTVKRWIRLQDILIEKETITGKEFMKIYRRCEGIPEPEEKKEENPVKEQTIEMPKKEADTEAARQEEKKRRRKQKEMKTDSSFRRSVISLK